jgi:hypothetical protein
MTLRCRSCGTFVNKLGDLHQCGDVFQFALDVAPVQIQALRKSRPQESRMSSKATVPFLLVLVGAAILGFIATHISLVNTTNAQYLPLVVGYADGKVGAVAIAGDPSSKADCEATLKNGLQEFMQSAPPHATGGGVCVALPKATVTAPTHVAQSSDSAGESKSL